MSEKALSDGVPSPVPPPLLPRNSSRTKLTFPGIASLFVSLQRARSRASVAGSGRIILDSGNAPITHPVLTGDGAVSPRQAPLAREDLFVCAGAVDAQKLLRLARDSLLKSAVALGGNVLVNERWICEIDESKRGGERQYRVLIQYAASAARSEKPDPRKPVALENAQGIPGLMTVVQRQEHS